MAAHKTPTTRNLKNPAFPKFPDVDLPFTLTNFTYTICPKSQKHLKSYMFNFILPTTSRPNPHLGGAMFF